MQGTAAAATAGEDNMDAGIVVVAGGVEENGVVDGLNVAVHECVHGW